MTVSDNHRLGQEPWSLLRLQAHLGYKIHGDKIQPKVGKHKVREVKNHKVLEPHRNISKITRPARPSGGPAPLRNKVKAKKEEVHFPSCPPPSVCKIHFARA
jgi:hypothetical protein